MILLSWLFASVGSLLFGASVLQLFGWGMMHKPFFFLPMLAGSLLLAIVVRLCKRGRAVISGVLALLQFALCAYVVRSLGAGYSALIPCAICAGFVPFHLLMLCQEAGEEYPPTIWYLGLVFHGLSLFLLRAEYFMPVAREFKLSALLYVVFVIFALNELGLSQGMAGDRRPSPQMRLRNRLRAGAAALTLVIACNLKALGRAMDAAVAWVKGVIGVLLAWLFKDKPEEYVVSSNGGRMDLSALADASGEPALIWRVLEKIMYALALVAVVVLLALIVRKLWQLTKKFVKFLMEQLRRYSQQVTDAYEDTVESLVDWGEMRRALWLKREKRPRAASVNWAELSPRESVRMRFKVRRDKMKEAPAHLTARQVLSLADADQRAADLYDRARYSSAEVSAEDAREMKELLKR